MDSSPPGGNNGCGKEGGFVMSEDSYSAWVETDYLFGSPVNARRLLESYEQVLDGKAKEHDIDLDV